MADNEKSAKDGQIGAQGLDCKIFVSFYEKKYPRKQIMCEWHIWILAIFEISNGNSTMAIMAKWP